MSRPGFTLIELMIYLTLLGLIGIGIASAYNFFLTSSIETRSVAELRASSNEAIDPLRSALSKADHVEVLTGSGGQQCAIATTREKTSRSGLDFNGSVNLNLPGYNGVSGSQSRSTGFWMVQSDQNADRTIIDFGDAAGGERWRIYTTSAGGVVAVDIDGKVISGSTDIVDGNWNHVLVSFDNTSSDNFSASTLSIYVNGIAETLTESNSNDLNVDTDSASTALTIGSASDGSGGFIGQLASIKFWEQALSATMVWPEVLTTNAVGRDALAVEIILTDSIGDTAADNHSITAFSDPTFTTLTRSYARKISYGFTESPDNPAFEKLWSLEYIDTTDNETIDRCTSPDTATGWALTDASDWLMTADDAFSLDNGVVSINAEVATAIGEKQISVGNSNFILAGQGLDSSELCKIAPSMSGFNTGGNAVDEAVVRIDDDFFETGKDELTFFDATRTGPTTASFNGDNVTYYTFKDIKAEGVEVWTNITAEYVPDTGVMRICTTTGDNCTNPNLTTSHSIDDWEKVFQNITYTNSSQTYTAEKSFLFTLGGNIPCRIDNHIACRNINNDDFDDNVNTCYHYFNFISYDNLGSDYTCHETTGHEAAGYGQCLADWEDARALAGTDAYAMFGIRGYLATITSQAEYTCTDGKIAGAWGWIGASDRACERNASCGDATSNNDTPAGPYGKYNSKDTTDEGYWYWVTGPEGEWSSTDTGYQDHDGGAGQGLYFGSGEGSGFSVFDPPDLTDHTIPPGFINWAENQPNDWTTSGTDFPTQDYLQTYVDGEWNDDTSYDHADGFLIEYGGLSADPRRILTKRTSIDTFAFLKNCQ